MSKICVFFGHRTASSKIVESLKQQIRKLVLEEGIKVFWVGGYGDFDMYAASAVRTIKSELPDEGIELDLIYAYSNNYLEQKRIKRDESEFVYVKGGFPQIISAEQYERCRCRRSSPRWSRRERGCRRSRRCRTRRR